MPTEKQSWGDERGGWSGDHVGAHMAWKQGAHAHPSHAPSRNPSSLPGDEGQLFNLASSCKAPSLVMFNPD